MFLLYISNDFSLKNQFIYSSVYRNLALWLLNIFHLFLLNNSKEEYHINNTKNLGQSVIVFPTLSQFLSLSLSFLIIRQKTGIELA